MFNNSNFIKFTTICLMFTLALAIKTKIKEKGQDLGLNTYLKKEKKILTHKTTLDEIKNYNLALKKKNRHPASKNEEISKNKNTNTSKAKKKFNWEKKLATKLLKFQNEHTKLFIESIKQIDTKKGPREIVVISFRDLKKKTASSFSAEIDPTNGKMLSTWSKTIHESPIFDIKFTL